MFHKIQLRARAYVIALFAALLVAGLSSAAMAQVTTTTLDNATTQTGRLNRNAVASTCAAPKSNPGLITPTGTRAQDSYSIVNTSGATQCYTIALAAPPGNALFSAAYLGSFVPTNPDTNYLGDAGSSDVSTTYSVNVPNGQTLVVVVHEVNPGGGVGQTYTLTVSTPPAPVPTLSEWAMILMGLTLAGGAVVLIQRRRFAA